MTTSQAFTSISRAQDDPTAFGGPSERRSSPTTACFRVKGFVEIAGKPMRLAVQGVGDRIQHYFDRPWKADEPRLGKLVVIGEHDLDQTAITERRLTQTRLARGLSRNERTFRPCIC